MKITIEASEVRELLRAGVIVPSGTALETRFGDGYDEAEGRRLEIVDLQAKKETLEGEVRILVAQAEAARPVLEAQAVIDNAAKLWVDVDEALRRYFKDYDPGAESKERDALFRTVKALGDQLGEEGGVEDLGDPPAL